MKTISKVYCASFISFMLVGCGTTAQNTNAAKNISQQQLVNEKIQLAERSVVGQEHFPDGDTATGGQGQTVDGVLPQIGLLKYHIHAHISLFVNGKQIAIPKAIGVIPPTKNNAGYVTGSSYYWLHTHDATGIIHIESPIEQQFTLGIFFDIWGEPLDYTNVAGFAGEVHAFVDGKPYTGNLKKIELTSHGQITLEVGKPIVQPPEYIFPENLKS